MLVQGEPVIVVVAVLPGPVAVLVPVTSVMGTNDEQKADAFRIANIAAQEQLHRAFRARQDLLLETQRRIGGRSQRASK